MGAKRITVGVVGLAIVMAVVFGYAPRAYAGPGDLDPTFDGAGKVTTDLIQAFDVAVQSDGRSWLWARLSSTTSRC
jgi:hypothetical protein